MRRSRGGRGMREGVVMRRGIVALAVGSIWLAACGDASLPLTPREDAGEPDAGPIDPGGGCDPAMDADGDGIADRAEGDA